MRALTRGERRASIGVLAGLVGVLCLLVSTLALTLSYRAQLIDLKQTLEARCEARVEYDRRFIAAAEGDEQFYADALALVDRAAEARTEPLSAAVQKLVDEQREMIVQARDRKRAIVARGVLANCDQYRAVAR